MEERQSPCMLSALEKMRHSCMNAAVSAGAGGGVAVNGVGQHGREAANGGAEPGAMLPPPPKPTAADDEVRDNGIAHRAAGCKDYVPGDQWCGMVQQLYVRISVPAFVVDTEQANPSCAQDIFGDAGTDYELPERRAGDVAGAAVRDTYFDRKDGMRDLPALPSGAQGSGWKFLLSAVVRSLRRTAGDRRAAVQSLSAATTASCRLQSWRALVKCWLQCWHLWPPRPSQPQQYRQLISMSASSQTFDNRVLTGRSMPLCRQRHGVRSVGRRSSATAARGSAAAAAAANGSRRCSRRGHAASRLQLRLRGSVCQHRPSAAVVGSPCSSGLDAALITLIWHCMRTSAACWTAVLSWLQCSSSC